MSKKATKAKAKPAIKHEPATIPKVKDMPKKVLVSSPEGDFNHKTIPVNFNRRAGLKNHGEELVERLKDLEDDNNSETYYLLPVKLPKKVYKMLVEQAINLSKQIPDWNERDMLEVLVIFNDGKMPLTPEKAKA